MTTHATRVKEIATLIERYLRSHPHAADGVEGVLWWIPEIALEPHDLILDALETLVERGVAIKKHRDDGAVTYQLKPTDSGGATGG